MSRQDRFSWFRSRQSRRYSATRACDRSLSRKLHVEPLEDRRMLAVITIDSLEDNVDPNNETFDGFVTLREAIIAANTDLPFGDAAAGNGADTIQFDPGLFNPISIEEISLNSSPSQAFGELLITESTTILGPGADRLRVNANTFSRVFNVQAELEGGVVTDVAISGLTVAFGNAAGENGGGIYSDGNLLLYDVNIENSTAFLGGGIYVTIANPFGGTVSIQNSRILGNTAFLNGGGLFVNAGGTYDSFGSFTIANAVIHDNEANSRGGGIYALVGGDSFDINSSTISGNTASKGGGLFAHSVNTQFYIPPDPPISDEGYVYDQLRHPTLTNSSVSGNTASDDGGGIYLLHQAPNTGIDQFGANDTLLQHTTVTKNTASGSSGGFSRGAGLVVSGGSAAITHSIVSGNVDVQPVALFPQDIATRNGELNAVFSLLGSVIGANVNSADTIFDLDPRLAPLADNGGPTPTHALLIDSPAINAGNPAIASSPDFDQRGVGFDRVQFDAIDIGSTEFQESALPSELIVSTTLDIVDGNYAAGELSLREAVELANFVAGANTITFAASLSGQSILLNGTDLEITDSLTIDAAALAENVTIDAQQQSRVLNFSALTGDLTLAGITLTGGRTTGDNSSISDSTHSGGGIRFLSNGILTLVNSAVTGNSTTGEHAYGGGIYTKFGDVSLTSSTVSGNKTIGHNADGGGIWAQVGGVSLTSSTVSGNSTSGGVAYGGGISTIAGDVNLTSSTVSGNSTSGGVAYGGGISTIAGNVSLTSSTVSGNRTTGAGSEGGGIRTRGGDVSLTSSTVSGNSTIGLDTDGGGIWTGYGDVSLTSSTVNGNTSSVDGGGIHTFSGTVTLISSTVSGNSTTAASSTGGGIFTRGGDVSLTGSTVSGNRSARLGGGIVVRDLNNATVHIDHSTITDNVVGSLGGSGRDLLASWDAEGNAADSASSNDGILRNGASFGPGKHGQAFVFDGVDDFVEVPNNPADFSTPLRDGDFTIELWARLDSLGGGTVGNPEHVFIGHDEGGGQTNKWFFGVGGGLLNFHFNGPSQPARFLFQVPFAPAVGSWHHLAVTASQTTYKLFVDGNEVSTVTDAPGTPGIPIVNAPLTLGQAEGFFMEGALDGVRIHDAALSTFQRIFIAGDTHIGGGLFVDSGVIVDIDHSIVAGNRVFSAPLATDLTGSFQSTYSLIGDATGSNLIEAQVPDANGNLVGSRLGSGNIDPLLAPLADNGGPTQTHALLPGSPAIDAGDPGFSGPPNFDQRGFAFDRVVGGRIDIGAVESGATSADFDHDTDVDGADFLTWQRGFGATTGATLSDGDANGDGAVDADDLAVWDLSFGQTTPPVVVAALFSTNANLPQALPTTLTKSQQSPTTSSLSASSFPSNVSLRLNPYDQPSARRSYNPSVVRREYRSTVDDALHQPLEPSTFLSTSRFDQAIQLLTSQEIESETRDESIDQAFDELGEEKLVLQLV